MFFLSKRSQKSRSILKMNLVIRKGKIHFIAKFHRTDLVVYRYPRERNLPSYVVVTRASASACISEWMSEFDVFG